MKEKQSLLSVSRSPPPYLEDKQLSLGLRKVQDRPGGQHYQRCELGDLTRIKAQDVYTFPEVSHFWFILRRFTNDQCSLRHSAGQLEKVLQISYFVKIKKDFSTIFSSFQSPIRAHFHLVKIT